MSSNLLCRWCKRGGKVGKVFGGFNKAEPRPYYFHKPCVGHATTLGGFYQPTDTLNLQALWVEEEESHL